MASKDKSKSIDVNSFMEETQFLNPESLQLLYPTQELSKQQKRTIAINKLVLDEFKMQDQLIKVTPISGPSALKRMNPKMAAEYLVDKMGVLPTDEEIEQYELENKLAQQEIQKQLDRNDLAKAVQRTVNG